MKSDNLTDCFDCGGDMHLRVERTDTNSNRSPDGCSTYLFMHERCAVQTGAASDIVLTVQKGARIKCLHAIYVEADDTDVIVQIILTVKCYSIQFFKTVPEHTGQPHFMVVNFLNAPG